MVISYIFPVLVFCSKINLATLLCEWKVSSRRFKNVSLVKGWNENIARRKTYIHTLLVLGPPGRY
jgi:hypothetical protein